MADIVLALKPKWLELILSGKKTAEVRRTLPARLEPGDKVYFYCKGDIHGFAFVEDVYHVVDYITKRQYAYWCAEHACLTEQEILNYWNYGYNGRFATSPGVILLQDVQRYEDPHPWRGSTPQNFIYYHDNN